MSQRREQLAQRLPDLDAMLDWAEAWYHVPMVLVLAGFMLWIRVRNWKNFVIGGQVYFSGNDAWYHLRQVRYTVQHWPWTMPFDPWTSYPTGTSVGQFGTLYDQIVATVALAVGLGNPTEQTTALVLLFAPAVLGTLVVVPTYFLGKRFGGRFGGVVGVAVLALSPSAFLYRSVVGFSDHHVAEALFQALAVAAIVVALGVAEREKPVYEQFVERDLSNLRRPVGWAALAGFAITLYVWTWPPGLLLVGIFGVFLLIALPFQYLRGESPEHVAIAGAVALSVAGLLLLLTFKTFEISVTNFSILHPALALTGAVGCAFMAWLARTVEARDLPASTYPGTIYGLLVLGTLVMWVALPTLFGFFLDQLGRIIAFGTNNAALTVAEVQPPYTVGAPFDEIVNDIIDFFRQSYGLAFITAAAGAVVMLGRLAFSRTNDWASTVFVLVWTGVMTSATLTQARFNYYLLVPIAVLNAYLVGQILRLVGSSDAVSSLRDVDAYQVISVLAVVFVVTAPLAAGSGGALTAAGTAADRNTRGPGSVVVWDDSLDWLQNNTPEVGQYNGNSPNSFGYYETFQPTDDYNYSNGAYGILSWWDYGHWITTLGHRVPVANPFQQNARLAANFLLATNASAANEIARMPDGEAEGVRYVMISWSMADPAGIIGAPFAWENKWSVSYSDAVSPIFDPQLDGNRQTVFLAYDQRYYESMRTRLYAFHGSAIEPEPVVLDYENPVGRTNDSLVAAFYPTNTSVVKRFPNMSAARQFVEEDGSAQIGGVGRYPHERVAALEHYRLVNANERSSRRFSRTLFQRSQVTGLNRSELMPTTPSWVKTFERVPGATVEGTGPANTTVEATVEMRIPSTNTTFNYTQQATTNAEGEFTMTLPYSTTGYEKWGTERGATNVSVRATGPYTFRTPVEGTGDNATRWTATAEVPEGAVIGRTNETITVDLQQKSVSIPVNATSGNATNDTSSANASAATNASATENGSAGTNTSSAESGANATDTNATDTNATDANATGANATNASTMAAPGERVAGAALTAPTHARVAR